MSLPQPKLAVAHTWGGKDSACAWAKIALCAAIHATLILFLRVLSTLARTMLNSDLNQQHQGYSRRDHTNQYQINIKSYSSDDILTVKNPPTTDPHPDTQTNLAPLFTGIN